MKDIDKIRQKKARNMTEVTVIELLEKIEKNTRK